MGFERLVSQGGRREGKLRAGAFAREDVFFFSCLQHGRKGNGGTVLYGLCCATEGRNGDVLLIAR